METESRPGGSSQLLSQSQSHAHHESSLLCTEHQRLAPSSALICRLVQQHLPKIMSIQAQTVANLGLKSIHQNFWLGLKPKIKIQNDSFQPKFSLSVKLGLIQAEHFRHKSSYIFFSFEDCFVPLPDKKEIKLCNHNDITLKNAVAPLPWYFSWKILLLPAYFPFFYEVKIFLCILSLLMNTLLPVLCGHGEGAGQVEGEQPGVEGVVEPPWFPDILVSTHQPWWTATHLLTMQSEELSPVERVRAEAYG